MRGVSNKHCLLTFFILYNKLGTVHCTYLGMVGSNFKTNIAFFCLKVLFYLYSVDPDEMQYSAAFHQDLHRLQKYSLWGFSKYKGLLIFYIVELVYMLIDLY